MLSSGKGHPLLFEQVACLAPKAVWAILIIKPTRCTKFSNLFLEQNSTSGWNSVLIPLASSQHNLYGIYLLLCVQCQTPDDGQRNCPKHVEFYSKNKLEKIMHLIAFIIRIYHDARSSECQRRTGLFAKKNIFCLYRERKHEFLISSHQTRQYTDCDVSRSRDVDTDCKRSRDTVETEMQLHVPYGRFARCRAVSAIRRPAERCLRWIMLIS